MPAFAERPQRLFQQISLVGIVVIADAQTENRTTAVHKVLGQRRERIIGGNAAIRWTIQGDVALPVAPAPGGRCTGSRGALAQAIPVAWGPGGLEAIVEGEPVLVSPDLARASGLAAFLDQAWTPGSPRAPDGKTYVVPTPAGLLVRGPAGVLVLPGAWASGKALECPTGAQERLLDELSRLGPHAEFVVIDAGSGQNRNNGDRTTN